MADENDAKRSIRALQYGLASLKMVVRRQQVMILLGLMVTSLLAPVVSLTEGSDMSEETEIRRPLLGVGTARRNRLRCVAVACGAGIN